MTLEARRQLLLVACTVDRVALLARFRTTRRGLVPGGLRLDPAWLGAAATVAARFLPPKLRVLNALWQIWRRR